MTIKSSKSSPPPFSWDDWYEGVGGRSIDISEVDEYLWKIEEEQFPLFDGPKAGEKKDLGSPEAAAVHLKNKCRALGADIIGYYYCSICLPVCAYNHKNWAKDSEGRAARPFPEVVKNEPLEPMDDVAENKKHYYPKVNR